MKTPTNTIAESKKDAHISFSSIAPLLDTGSNKASKILTYIGLGLGVLLLLCSLQIYIDINFLLKDKDPRKNGFDYLSITKTVTDKNMGMDNRFSKAEIADIESRPFISGAAPLMSNQFRVKASAGSIIPFSTDLFLESVDNDFIDTLPSTFSWHPGQADVPVIFSADFLEMYNVFAPSQDLPQLSQNSISAVNIILECYGPQGVVSFRGHIVAVSDRINSVLVPESFLSWANSTFGNAPEPPAARVYIKTKDANNPALLTYLQEKNYHVNKDKTKFGRVKQILQAVVTGLGAFAIVVILLALMLFSFYLQLMIARSRENLALLITLGYSPVWLSKTVAGRWLRTYAIIIVAALVATSFLQFIFQHYAVAGNAELLPVVHWAVIALAILLFGLCVAVNYRLIKRLLLRL